MAMHTYNVHVSLLHNINVHVYTLHIRKMYGLLNKVRYIKLQVIFFFLTELSMHGLDWDSIIAKRDSSMMPYTGM